MSLHPALEQLQALARGELDEAAAAPVAAHTASCPECQATCAVLTRDDEDLAQELRQAAAQDPRLKSSGLQATDLPPDAFPGFELIEELHHGGQGVVYRAVQRSTKREVAVKVMKDGPFASRRDQARFEREIEVLAQLHHPSIVAIHDSGRARGHFYFVMDYIPGRPLDAWLAAKTPPAAKSPAPSVPGARPPILDVLRLFAKICDAVNAAHLRGVMHRDLKPGNILVDAQDQPHILDFGLAKRSETAENSLATMTGQFMGSMPWASPEQAEGIPGGVDIRTDVYSLGVVLYHALTGRFPYEVVGSMREVLDRIVKTEPVSPSSIRPEIDDEIETILRKCLAKEPHRRYQSAGEIALDIGRYLAGEPIAAKRDSTLYILRKRLHRHRISAAVTLAFVVLISAASVALFVFWRQAVVERNRAEDASYVGLISLADRRTTEGEWSQAREALTACSPRRRGWEWGHLALCAYTDGAQGFHRLHLGGEARMLAFSPDGESVVVGATDCTLTRWAVRTGEMVAVFQGHEDSVEAVAWSADGAHIASGGEDRTVHLWDPRSAQPRGALLEMAGPVNALAFSPDSRTLAVGTDQPGVALYEVATRALLRRLDTPAGVRKIAYSPSGGQIAAAFVEGGTHGHQVRVWTGADGHSYRDFQTGGKVTTAVAFSADGGLLAVGNFDGTCCVLETASGRVRKRITQRDPVHGLSFSPDGTRLAVVVAATVHFYDTASWQDLMALGVTTGEGAVFNPAGDILATCGGNLSAMVWFTCPWDESRYPAGPSWDERIAAYCRDHPSARSSTAMNPTLAGFNLLNPVCRVRLCSSGSQLNGQPVGIAQGTVRVAPGERLTGEVRVEVSTHGGVGSMAPVGATVNWGDRATQCWEVEATHDPGTKRQLDVHVDKTVPLEPGIYHLVIACNMEKTFQQVLSATNWTYDERHGHVAWGDGNDIGFDWSPEQYWQARAYGCTTALLQSVNTNSPQSLTLIGATCVDIFVSAKAATTRPATNASTSKPAA